MVAKGSDFATFVTFVIFCVARKKEIQNSVFKSQSRHNIFNALVTNELSRFSITFYCTQFINRHHAVDSEKWSHFLFVSVEFSNILLGMQITFINKKFDKPIKISCGRKYIKREVVFWKLTDNVSFQTTLYLSIWSMFFPQSNSVSPGSISAFFIFLGFFFCLFLFLYFFHCFFYLLPSELCYYLLPKVFQQGQVDSAETAEIFFFLLNQILTSHYNLCPQC